MLTESQQIYASKCTITHLRNKYIVQTPMGFYAGSFRTEKEAEAKVLGLAKFH